MRTPLVSISIKMDTYNRLTDVRRYLEKEKGINVPYSEVLEYLLEKEE